MLVVAAGLGMWQIITRFIIERPAEWTEVLIRFSLIWMVFLGIPMAFRARRDGQRGRALPLERRAHAARAGHAWWRSPRCCSSA